MEQKQNIITNDELLTSAHHHAKPMLAEGNFVRPVRVQRQRTKGWKMPENTVYVSRPTKFGNPYKVVSEDGYFFVKDSENNYWGGFYNRKEDAHKKSVECFSGYIDRQIGLKKIDVSVLKGKNLACFCPPNCSCHADILLKIVNEV